MTDLVDAAFLYWSGGILLYLLTGLHFAFLLRALWVEREDRPTVPIELLAVGVVFLWPLFVVTSSVFMAVKVIPLRLASRRASGRDAV